MLGFCFLDMATPDPEQGPLTIGRHRKINRTRLCGSPADATSRLLSATYALITSGVARFRPLPYGYRHGPGGGGGGRGGGTGVTVNCR